MYERPYNPDDWETENYDKAPPKPDPIDLMIKRCWKILGAWTREDEKAYQEIIQSRRNKNG